MNSRKRVKSGRESRRGEPVTKKPKTFGQLLKSTVFPKEHANCPFCDSRVYIPTVRDFITDTEQGSMLEEVSLLPLEDLTSLMCGSTVYSLIKKTDFGARLRETSAMLQNNHVLLNLRAIANEDGIKRGSFRLLRYEGCK
ncbi:hypothetical protein OSTOST_08606 [Ostertagia ostertagi]